MAIYVTEGEPENQVTETVWTLTVCPCEKDV